MSLGGKIYSENPNWELYRELESLTYINTGVEDTKEVYGSR